MESVDLDAVRTGLLEPLVELVTGEPTSLDSLKEMAPVLEETARIIYSNNTITVNIIWAGLAVAAGLALLLKLFFGLTLFDVMDAMTGATYGSTGYGTGYAAPDSGYAAPSSGYNSRTYEEDIQLTPEQKALYPELAKLQDQLNELKDSEYQLRQQIFYGSEPDLSNAATAHIGYSY